MKKPICDNAFSPAQTNAKGGPLAAPCGADASLTHACRATPPSIRACGAKASFYCDAHTDALYVLENGGTPHSHPVPAACRLQICAAFADIGHPDRAACLRRQIELYHQYFWGGDADVLTGEAKAARGFSDCAEPLRGSATYAGASPDVPACTDVASDTSTCATRPHAAPGPPVEGPNAYPRTILAIEDLSPLPVDEPALAALYARGVRLCSLTWNPDNPLAGGCMGAGVGLSAAGRMAVRGLVDVGITPDLSHASAQTFADVLELTPTIMVSHAGARTAHDHPRNLQRWQVRELVARHGFLGVPVVAALLGDGPTMASFSLATTGKPPNAAHGGLAASTSAAAFPHPQKQSSPDVDCLEDGKRTPSDADCREGGKQAPSGVGHCENIKKNPPGVERWSEHVARLLDWGAGGILGLGSDFDGAPFYLNGLSGPEDVGLLWLALEKRGLSPKEISAIRHDNLWNFCARVIP